MNEKKSSSKIIIIIVISFIVLILVSFLIALNNVGLLKIDVLKNGIIKDRIGKYVLS